jgi:hypothetical protein
VQIFFSFISGILCLLAYVPYIVNILSCKTKPQRMSWFLWLVLGIISLASQASLGATYSLVLAYILTLGSLVIFLLSIKYGTGGFTARDIWALLFSIAGLVIWLMTNMPLISLAINIAIGSVGALLTIKKTIEHPGSETAITWLLASVAGLASLVSTGHLRLGLIAYPLYIILTNFAVYISCQVHRKVIV